MSDKVKIMLTDDAGHFWREGKLFKLRRWLSAPKDLQMKGLHQGEYIEVDPEEYDAKVEKLARKIAAYPDVDLLDVLRDALYDEPLVFLDKLEKKLQREDTRAEEVESKPRVETRRGERGTCVELRIAGRYGMTMRI